MTSLHDDNDRSRGTGSWGDWMSRRGRVAPRGLQSRSSSWRTRAGRCARARCTPLRAPARQRRQGGSPACCSAAAAGGAVRGRWTSSRSALALALTFRWPGEPLQFADRRSCCCFPPLVMRDARAPRPVPPAAARLGARQRRAAGGRHLGGDDGPRRDRPLLRRRPRWRPACTRHVWALSLAVRRPRARPRRGRAALGPRARPDRARRRWSSARASSGASSRARLQRDPQYGLRPVGLPRRRPAVRRGRTRRAAAARRHRRPRGHHPPHAAPSTSSSRSPR